MPLTKKHNQIFLIQNMESILDFWKDWRIIAPKIKWIIKITKQ